jgi:hypothetical protein
MVSRPLDPYVVVTRSPYALRRASLWHLDVILGLVGEAVDWLRGKNTDQWAKPWPDRRSRDERIRHDLASSRTWIVWDGAVVVGMISIGTDDPVDLAGNHVWPVHRRRERALYVHRVITRRSYAGRGLGAGLFNWASRAAEQEIGTPLIRIDVWTENRDLHAYCRRQGFILCEVRDPRALPGYPSRALFERRTSPEENNGTALFSAGQPATSGQTCR